MVAYSCLRNTLLLGESKVATVQPDRYYSPRLLQCVSNILHTSFTKMRFLLNVSWHRCLLIFPRSSQYVGPGMWAKYFCSYHDSSKSWKYTRKFMTSPSTLSPAWWNPQGTRRPQTTSAGSSGSLVADGLLSAICLAGCWLIWARYVVAIIISSVVLHSKSSRTMIRLQHAVTPLSCFWIFR